MAELPTGTVTLLFSDIEGSTVLLSRLGPAYADALDGQRRVLRAAWTAHGGTEMGTEGDSFYVVFATAPTAVAAAVQAQRGLDSFEWPAGEQVRVRMGLHTGSPAIHDGAYVGMDVHRAARIAGCAHGGQVLMSEATAKLVGAALPDGVWARDLGAHRLKDIATPERLFQLVVDGLPADFPTIRSLGAASSLPVPPGALVGREGELAELRALLSRPDVRLVTLTGPGGSGKTRLAIGVAQRSVETVPDGVYFVPLAAVGTEEAMWAGIGEVLDVPPERRLPPSFLNHVAHRSALLVLDNLEQLSGADRVVSQLLGAVPRVTLLTTSRRPLHVSGEHEHPVPPLELPDQATLQDAERSGAIQKFVQHARMVRPDFKLTDDNVADVVEICRSLDGLPLAIELAAARTKLLSPAALVARLDKVLELKDASVDRPTRQRTMRDTIAWSYDLLTPRVRSFFRRLGVFVGGADLDAITAVTADVVAGADPLDMVADLADASLATIADGPDGEPRIGSLETIRTFAQDQLDAAGETDAAHHLHARHYLNTSQQWRLELMNGGVTETLQARRRFQLEAGNVRAALDWALRLPSPESPPSPDRIRIGLQLCGELYVFWDGGNFIEGRDWLERAVARADHHDSPELAECLSGLVWLCTTQGDAGHAEDFATRCVQMWRRIGDKHKLSLALSRFAMLKQDEGELKAARLASEEAVALARGCSSDRLASALSVQARQEALEHNFEGSVELERKAASMYLELGDEYDYLDCCLNIAGTLRMLGKPGDAQQQLRPLIPRYLRLAEPDLLILLLESFGAVLTEQGAHEEGTRLLGAAEAARQQHGVSRTPAQAAAIDGPYAHARAALSHTTWNHELDVGRTMSAEEALTQICPE